jgi:hypothetical protein
MLAQLVGRGEELAGRIADEFAAHSMTVAGVQLAKDAVRFMPKGLFKLASSIFDRFEQVERTELSAGSPKETLNDVLSETEKVPA